MPRIVALLSACSPGRGRERTSQHDICQSESAELKAPIIHPMPLTHGDFALGHLWSNGLAYRREYIALRHLIWFRLNGRTMRHPGI